MRAGSTPAHPARNPGRRARGTRHRPRAKRRYEASVTLWELDEPVSRLRGVGGAKSRDLARLGVTTVRDLLLLAPRSYEDRRTIVDFARAMRLLSSSASGSEPVAVNTTAKVVAHDYIGGRKGQPTLKVILEDSSGIPASLACFGRNFLSSRLPPGQWIRLYAPVTLRYGELQASSFDFEPVPPPAENASRHVSPGPEPEVLADPPSPGRSLGAFDRILPVYPLSGSLTQGGMRTLAATAIAHYGKNLVATLPESVRLHEFDTATAIAALHFPSYPEIASKARQALAHEEFLLLQLRIVRAAALRRAQSRSTTPLPVGKRKALTRALSFTLTDDQKRTVEEIHADMESSHPMHRMLQGDVGSGKTMVALLSAVSCIEAGYQVALMAPTALLARQHADNAARFLEPVGVRTAFFTGSLVKAKRAPLLESVARGDVDLLVGTHALFNEEVRFSRLKLAIIDEQQRFGVLQRAALEAKGEKTDVLVTTATPIPRTLALGLFGDLDISTIRTLPPGRKPVITHLARHGNERKVYRSVAAELERGHQAYFVYPLIEEGSKSDIRDATAMRDELAERVFPEARVGLVHSRLNDEEKAATMAAFARGDLDILVATSVVEVGVDVSNATCMVIEHAERFGLSALHQLRGRVGRSEKQSYCFLVYSDPLTDAGKERMRVMHRTTDGFEIAEEDLRIRGPGNVAGTRQSGYVKLHIADLASDFDLLKQARATAERLVEQDAGLIQPVHQTLRAGLNAFSRAMIDG
ncbi:MAG: ATP-dependent DNA helicase RecG [Spirochaetales bacterium]